MTDLATVRRHMEIRRRAFGRAISDGALLNDLEGQLVTLRCEHHTNGKSPKLAEALVHKGVFYFASRIQWRPDDQTKRTPWMTEHFFGAGSAPGSDFWQRAMTDDEFLSSTIKERELDPTVTGERWIKSTEHWIRYAVPLANFTDFEALGLWTRCKDHPQHAEKNDPRIMVEALR